MADELRFWNDYKERETEFLEITETIPLVKEHLLRPWSPKIRNLMSDTYNSFEYVFREMITRPEYDNIRKNVKRKKKDIHFYREILEPVHSLSSKSVIVKAENVDDISPFLNFKYAKSPDWWKAINGVRHEWDRNRKKANLKNIVEAMAGLFILNILNKPSRIELATMNIIKSDDIVPTSRDKRQWEQILISLQNGYKNWNFRAETQLFVLQFPLGCELREYFGI